MYKSSIAALLIAVGCTSGFANESEEYPKKPVRLLIPYTPGGNADVLARLLSKSLSDKWGKPVIAENIAGASGTIAVNTVANALPDGYTLVIGAAGNLIVPQKLIKNLPYDPQRDLQAITLVSSPPFVLVVNEKSIYKNISNLIDYSKAHPDKVNFGSAGIGSANHLSGELLGDMTNSKFTHVAYKGMGPALNDLISGHLDFAFAPIPLVLPHMKSGRLRVLAVSGMARSDLLKDIPTVDESGVKGFESGAWFALMTTKGTPKEIIEKINLDVKSVIKDAAFVKRLAQEGAQPIGLSPEETTKSQTNEIKKWGALIDKLNITQVN